MSQPIARHHAITLPKPARSRGPLLMRIAAIAAALAAIAMPARADSLPLDALVALQTFGLIDFGNYSTSSESEGRMWIGGNLSGNLSNVGFNNGLVAAPYATLTVNGSVASGSNVNVQSGNISVGGSMNGNATLNNAAGTTSVVGGNVNSVTMNGGTLQYGGSLTGNVNANGGAIVQRVPGVTGGLGSTTFAGVSALVSSLEQLTANSSVAIANGTATFTAAPVNGVAIFRITSGSAFFAAINQLQFNLNGATSVYINVDGGGAITAAANFLGGATSIARKIIWNFNNASSLNINSEFGGAILAPTAAVSNSISIDGTLVAGSLNQGGELHAYYYSGALPQTAIPEPDSLAVLASALAMLTLARGLRRPGRADPQAPVQSDIRPASPPPIES